MVSTRILVAEDNDLTALMLERQLVSLGYDVIGVARTGAEAVDLAKRLGPDVIIMDIRMPEIDGTEAAAWITKECPTPILMLTAYTDGETIHRAQMAGALAYLVKPVKESELTPTINIALARFHDLQDLRTQVGELTETLEARKLIERMKEPLIQRVGLTERETYERLRQHAHDKPECRPQGGGMSKPYPNPHLLHLIAHMRVFTHGTRLIEVGLEPQERVLALELLQEPVERFIQCFVESERETLVLNEAELPRIRSAFPHARVDTGFRAISIEIDRPDDLVAVVTLLTNVLDLADVTVSVVLDHSRAHLLVREADLETSLWAIERTIGGAQAHIPPQE